jgi:tetratricopeptide (TPR) repeat protein
MTPFQMPTLPPEAAADERTIAAFAARAIALAKAGCGREAIALAKVARAQAQGMEMDRGEVQALNAAAIVHLLRGDPISAIAAAMDACQVARRVDDRALAAHAQVSLHLSAHNLGARDDVERGLRGCIAEAIAVSDPQLEVRARTALGVIHGDAGRFDAAAFELRCALATAERHDGMICPARLVANLANLHRKRARAELSRGSEASAARECVEAEALARRACVLAARDGAAAVEIDALAIWGCVQRMQGDPVRARALLQESVALGRAARSRPAIVWILCELAGILLEQADLDGAWAAYGEALEIAGALRPSSKVAAACEGLAEVAERRGDAAEAQHWRRRAAQEAEDDERARRQTRQQVDTFLLAA